jgi:hypothetical protein
MAPTRHRQAAHSIRRRARGNPTRPTPCQTTHTRATRHQHQHRQPGDHQSSQQQPTPTSTIHHRGNKYSIKQVHNEEQQKRNQHNHLADNSFSIMITWVAGHMDSTGKEAADELAKAAVEFGSSDKHFLPKFLRNTLPSSLSATKKHIKHITSNDTKRWWKRSKRYKRIRAIDPTLPSKNFLLATSELSRTQTSLLTQLRTGHAPLNQYLHRINRSDTPYCQHCDVPHLLLSCNKYSLHRHKLVTALRRKAHEISHLLSDRKAIYHTLNFLNDTGRFEHLYGDISAQQGE